jgi:hypothetical protein
METIRGRKSLELDFNGFKGLPAGRTRIIIDLGTGDGRFVHDAAENDPGSFVIGIDTCRENLREHSRAKLQNMLFIIAGAQALPSELTGLVSHLTINFPWGSLLESLLTGDPRLFPRLESLSRSVTSFDIRLNGGALKEAGWTLETGAERIKDNLISAGWDIKTPVLMKAEALRTFPSTWAKRLAFGRDPRALMLSGWFSRPPQRIKQQT